MTARLVALLAVFAVVALHAAPARAQAESDARAQAAAHVRQGQAFFERGNFDRALAEYQTALDLSAEPSLIFNVALCHDRAYRPEEALKAFQRYLELAPNGSVAEEARADVARLTPIVEKIAADREAEQARKREEAARRAEAARRTEAAVDRAAAAAHRARVARYVMVSGAMVVAGGAIAHFVTWQNKDRVANEHDPQRFLDDRHTYMIQREVTFATYAVGGVTLATGLVLALIARSAGDGAQLSAAITPGGATLSVAWSR